MPAIGADSPTSGIFRSAAAGHGRDAAAGPRPPCRDLATGAAARRITAILLALAGAAAAHFLAVYAMARSAFPRPHVNQDTLEKLGDWAQGESLWQMVHHNKAPALIQTALAKLDFTLGPYPVYTEGFTIAATLLTAAVILLVLRHRGLPLAGAALAAMFLLYNASELNGDVLFYYHWRQSEVAVHYLSLAGLLLALIAFERRDAAAGTGLFLALVILSLTHKATLYPLVFLFVGAVTGGLSRRRVLAGLAILALAKANFILNVAHTIEQAGAPGLFATDIDIAPPPPGAMSAENHLRAFVSLISAPFGNFVTGLPNTVAYKLARMAIAAAALAAFAIAGWQALRRRDPVTVLAFALMGTGYAFMALTVADRLDRYGQAIDAVGRYWLDAFLVLFGILLFSLTWRRRWLRNGLFAAAIAYLAALQPLVWAAMPERVMRQQVDAAASLTLLLGGTPTRMMERRVAARHHVAPWAAREGAGLAASPLVRQRDRLAAPAPAAACALPVADGPVRIDAIPHRRLEIGLGAAGGADYAILWDGPAIAAATPIPAGPLGGRVRFDLPAGARPLTLALYDAAALPAARHACRLPPAPA